MLTSEGWSLVGSRITFSPLAWMWMMPVLIQVEINDLHQTQRQTSQWNRCKKTTGSLMNDEKWHGEIAEPGLGGRVGESNSSSYQVNSQNNWVSKKIDLYLRVARWQCNIEYYSLPRFMQGKNIRSRLREKLKLGFCWCDEKVYSFKRITKCFFSLITSVYMTFLFDAYI